MINRRQVIASGAAASFLAGTLGASLAGASAERRYAARPWFIMDERFAESHAAARAADRRGAIVRPVGPDVTDVYESLDLAWRSFPFAVAGLTAPSALFVIERLAWDRGLRTVYRGAHRGAHARALGRVQHALLGAPALTSRVGAGARERWAEQIGRELIEWAAWPDERARSVSAQPFPYAENAALASWLLVPKGALGAKV